MKDLLAANSDIGPSIFGIGVIPGTSAQLTDYGSIPTNQVEKWILDRGGWSYHVDDVAGDETACDLEFSGQFDNSGANQLQKLSSSLMGIVAI